jgi:hypothetical protein
MPLEASMATVKTGNPIAVIQPIRYGRRASSLEARLADLASRGVITLPSRKPRKGSRLITPTGPPLSRAILEDRR